MTKTRLLTLSASVAAVLSLSGCTASSQSHNVAASAYEKSPTILQTYADIALANYTDALNDAKELQNAIASFAADPTQQNFDNAKAAWLTSRESYGQTEIFRLSNGPIDAEEGWVAQTYGALEGQINAWPLDENMIDYTVDARGNKTSGNIIDTKGDFTPVGEDAQTVDVSSIDAAVLTALNENGGEANVATGYHAVEFLLWGQDQDYSNFLKDEITHGALQAGQRPLSDFTTDADAQRRLHYLKAAADKIVNDLQMVQSAWVKDVEGSKGLYRAALLGQAGDKSLSKEQALTQIFAGMGVFVKSELANERIAVAVLTPSEEDEHSCFSDNTHRDIVTNYQGFKNILMGTYNGRSFGKAPFDTLSAKQQKRLVAMMDSIEKKIASINATAQTSRHFDYQIKPNDPQARVIRNLKNELRRLGDEMIGVAQANGIDLNVNDVTDAEETKV